MNESFLLKLSLLISILGIIALFLVSKNIEINDTTIEKIANEKIQGDLIVKGVITKISANERVTYLTISQESELSVILFDNAQELLVNDFIEITGKMSDNNEIIAEKIVKLD